MKRGRRILLIEDDLLSRESLAYLLRREGHEVTAVPTAEKAQAMDCQPEVALIDIRLPGQRGDEFAYELQKRCPGIQLIFVSGEFVVNPTKGFEVPVRFFAKPIDLPALLRAIEQ